jgi:[ribosomal protein S5]-alanine N-acetyltransferase
MAFLRLPAAQEFDTEVAGHGVVLRPPVLSDYEAWAPLRGDNREHLEPWEPLWAHDELSRAAFRRRLRCYARDSREDMGYAFFVFESSTDALAGALTLSNVRRGVVQAAALGYWIGASFSGRGLMTEAVRAVVPFAFETLRLHRVEAACQPHNAGSRRVLEKAGFVQEGVARRHLKINGVWQDHLLFALLEDDRRVEARFSP